MLKRLGQIELAICVILLAIITALVFVAAIMRFFGHPLVWSVDLAQLLFIWVCFLGVIAKLGFDLAWLNRARTFGDSSISYAWVTVAVPVGCILLGIALIYNMVKAWQGRDKGKLVYTRTASDKDAPAVLEL